MEAILKETIAALHDFGGGKPAFALRAFSFRFLRIPHLTLRPYTYADFPRPFSSALPEQKFSSLMNAIGVQYLYHYFNGGAARATMQDQDS